MKVYYSANVRYVVYEHFRISNVNVVGLHSETYKKLYVRVFKCIVNNDKYKRT